MSANKDQRKVRFDENSEKHFVKQIQDMPREERAAMWIPKSDSDFHRKAEKSCDVFSERLRARVDRGFLGVFNMLEKSEEKAQDKLHRLYKACPSLRGLERLALPDFQHQRFEQRQKVVFAVLYAQKNFKNKAGEIDTEQVARVAKLFSRKGEKLALAMGAIDASIVEKESEVDGVEQSPKSSCTELSYHDQMHMEANVTFENEIEATLGLENATKSSSGELPVPTTIQIYLDTPQFTQMAA